jgi:hypothetical protein
MNEGLNLNEHIRDIQEISIAIDSWDDIFSDFDPSPLELRVLSEDFLLELRKRYRETQQGNYTITLYAPITFKDDNTERIVIKRLKQYFKFRHLSLTKELNNQRAKGGLFIVLGVGALGTMSMVTFFKLLSQLQIELYGIVLVPLGWFGIWEGFSRIIEPAPKLTQELALYSKLAKVTIKFKYAGQVK